MSELDINDIIGEQQPDVASESTLESEIDALSKIITDTKDSAPKLGDSDDFKLDSDDITFTTSLDCDSVPDDELGIKNILNSSGDLENFISGTENNLQLEANEISKPSSTIQESDKANNSKLQEPNENLEDSIKVSKTFNENNLTESVLDKQKFSVSNNLSLINEVDNSQESQSSNPDNMLESEIDKRIDFIAEKKETNPTKLLENMKNFENINKINIENENECQTNIQNIEFESMLKEEQENEDIDLPETDKKIDNLENQNNSFCTKNVQESELLDSDIKENQSEFILDIDKKEQKDYQSQECAEKLTNVNINKDTQHSSKSEEYCIVKMKDIQSDENIKTPEKADTGVYSNINNSPKSESELKNEQEQDVAESFETLENIDNSGNSGIDSNIENSQVNESFTNVQACQEITEKIETLSEADFDPYEDAVVDNCTEDLQSIDTKNENVKDDVKCGTICYDIKSDDINEKIESNAEGTSPEKLLSIENEENLNIEESVNKQNTDNIAIDSINSDVLNKTKESSQLYEELKDNESHDISGQNNFNSITKPREDVLGKFVITKSQLDSVKEQEDETIKSTENLENKGTDMNIENLKENESDDNTNISQTEPIIEQKVNAINAESLEDINNLENLKKPSTDLDVIQNSQSKASYPIIEQNFDLESMEEIEKKEETMSNIKYIEKSENIELKNLGESISDSHTLLSPTTDQTEKLIENIEFLQDTENSDDINDHIVDKKLQLIKTSIDTLVPQKVDKKINIKNLQSDELGFNTESLENIKSNNVVEISQDLNESEENTEIIEDSVSTTAECNTQNKLEDLDENIALLKSTLSVETKNDTRETVDIEENKDETVIENRDEMVTEKEDVKHVQSPKKINDIGDSNDNHNANANSFLQHIDEENNRVLETLPNNNELFVEEKKNNQESLKNEEMDENQSLKNNEQFEVVDSSEVMDCNMEQDTTGELVPEISELETAVKFLQESEEQNTEILKINEDLSTIAGNSGIFISVEDNICDNASDLISDLPEGNIDPIAISEAEIISEAAKLESEKEKLGLEPIESVVQEASNLNEDKTSALADTDDSNVDESNKISEVIPDMQNQEVILDVQPLKIPTTLETELVSKPLPKTSILEDRYTEHPKVEISDVSPCRVDLPSDALKASTSLEESKQQRSDSPDQQVISESKPAELPKKDSEKQQQQQQQQQQYSECENVGSPRIILKIAKSAIADCSEPRSPKSPKIRSAANSPNPEDSPSHKLGKIKLKLSKGGHPSIIPSTDSGYDETVQWHTEASSSLSAHGSMKIRLAKTPETERDDEETREKHKDSHKQKHKDAKEMGQETIKKQDSLGMKIKLSKTGDASIIQQDKCTEETISKAKDKIVEDIQECTKRTESPLGMKIKLSKSGDASIITNENIEEAKERLEILENSKKVSKTKERQEIDDTISDAIDENSKSGKMKIKLTKQSDASIVKKEDVVVEMPKKAGEQPLGMMKIKLSKTGDPSIIHPEIPKDVDDASHSIKTKHSKNKDHSTSSQSKSKDDSHLEMKIKFSKNGHPTIVTNIESQEDASKIASPSSSQSLKHKEHKDILTFKESTFKDIKKSHSDVSIEPITNQSIETKMLELHNKRKEITIAPIESKKSKVESNLKQMLPDITIQPIGSNKKEQQAQQKLLLESKSGSISQQQMNVINREISITQICSLSSGESLMGEHIKSLHGEPSTASPLNSDCEIIEPQPELIIVNENSNSSQDVMIIDEVPSTKSTKVPKKRGRPRRNTGALSTTGPATPFHELDLQRDPLSLDPQPVMPPIAQQPHLQMQLSQPLLQQQQMIVPQIVPGNVEGSERPRRTCRSQKSYAPPKRGRGRGRGKRKNEAIDIPAKKACIEQDLSAIEASTTALIALEKLPIEATSKSPELFKALSQPTLHRVDTQSNEIVITEVPLTVESLPQRELIEMAPRHEELENQTHGTIETREETSTLEDVPKPMTSEEPSVSDKSLAMEQSDKKGVEEVIMDRAEVIDIKVTEDEEKRQQQQMEIADGAKDQLVIQEHQNWIAPSIKKVSADPPTTRTEPISTLTVIDEETRMSAESCSRSQTPARSVPVPGAPETLVANEESQGSVLSTATTESEKVKVKNRRMEINFDPDEGPFTVDKIAEYEWPIVSREERPAGSRGETFMIQEQISQYLGVKSFKRKYPDLKRRMVDMEERNFLRENGLVSEAMCDMGLTAVSSSEVLDIMCSDFPEQYEEYRKHMREKAAKEHSKKQKELTAAANAERNRIDLAEMAVQSALSWNAGLNKARRDSRKCSLDLQTFTVQVPLKRHLKYDPSRRTNHYPVALIPGQYAEYFREYTPAELRYYPLNTVLYGPMRPNERKFDSQSEGSQSDSDSDSSSDDSSSSSSEGTQDTEGSQSTMDEVDMELTLQSDVKCKICMNNLNKSNRPEVLIQCGTCNGNVHPSCIDLTLDMVPHIRAYAWQCTDCKTCAQCHDPADEDKMLFCDMCDRGYHIYCVGLRRVPQGRWHCQECAVCANCGSKEPGGANSDRNSVAQWQHEYKKADKNTRVYVSTFCVPCSKLWRKGRYCPHCCRCHNAPRIDLEPNLVHCGACDKYLHLDCVETKGVIIDKKNYLCDFCSPNRQPLVKPLMSKTFKT